MGYERPLATGRLEFQTCRWRCGSQCFGEQPNCSSSESFTAMLAQRLRGRPPQGTSGLFGVTVAGRGATAAPNSPYPTAAPAAPMGPLVIRCTDGTATAPGTPAQLNRATPAGTGFAPIPLNQDDRVTLPQGYAHGVLIRWGDPLTADAPEFDFAHQTPAAQACQFGYNCDYVSFLPLPAGSGHSGQGLIWVNHEYTNPELMFPDYETGSPSRQQVAVEMMAHGGSVVAVQRQSDGSWRYRQGSPFNRRITAQTEMLLAGPAAGHRLTRTGRDPSGRRVLGTVANCAGGTTPWGTILSGEENFHFYFGHADQLPDRDPRTAIHQRYGLCPGPSLRRWERYHPRFDLAREPNEPFRFGWVVEIDPYHPTCTPRKRTALGRFKHEGATPVVAPDGRVVVYMGDDQPFEYIYKFVSKEAYRPGNRAHNLTLLDQGTLYAARFRPDGTGEWLPLVFGLGPLTPAHGFHDQGDVVINARTAADLLGATRMDRPEDIEVHPANGRVYVALTNNSRRANEQTDPANPRPINRHGHVIEWCEGGGDPTATTFAWEIFLLCGDPRDPRDGFYAGGFPIEQVSAISCPDNLVFDRRGNLWICTDGQPSTFKKNDGIYVVPTTGPNRGNLRRFMTGPVGAEICGPVFTPDGRTLFCAIQHPGEGGSLDQPTSDWPDGGGRPPRPSVVAIWRAGAGVPGLAL